MKDPIAPPAATASPPDPGPAQPDRLVPPPLSPGDEAPPGTPGTGEGICRRCDGTGCLGEVPCPECEGTGHVTVGIGGG